jgi:hypothetical protein
VRRNGMGFLERADAKFVDRVIDDTRRRAEIERLSGKRRVSFGSSLGLSVLFLLVVLAQIFRPTEVGSVVVGLFGLSIAVQLLTLVRLQLELRLLQVIERLKIPA